MSPATKRCSACQAELAADALFCLKCGQPQVEAASDPLVGQVVADRYLIRRRLGAGSSGTVYEARHVTLQQRVAVKVLHHHLCQDPVAVERFRREATTVAQIESPHLIGVRDFGDVGDGRLYLAMEFLEGETLADRLARHGPLDLAETVALLEQVSDGLAEAHARGYVHRDLRPANLFLVRRERGRPVVKVMDFGLSKLVATEQEASQATVGMSFGDPTYLSPEQAAGEPVSQRTDVYALAVIAYEMLVGAPPFRGDDVFATINLHLRGRPELPSRRRRDLPTAVDDVLLRGLAKRPADRFSEVSELVAALRQALLGSTAPGLGRSDKPRRGDDTRPSVRRALSQERQPRQTAPMAQAGEMVPTAPSGDSEPPGSGAAAPEALPPGDPGRTQIGLGGELRPEAVLAAARAPAPAARGRADATVRGVPSLSEAAPRGGETAAGATDAPAPSVPAGEGPSGAAGAVPSAPADAPAPTAPGGEGPSGAAGAVPSATPDGGEGHASAGTTGKVQDSGVSPVSPAPAPVPRAPLPERPDGSGPHPVLSPPGGEAADPDPSMSQMWYAEGEAAAAEAMAEYDRYQQKVGRFGRAPRLSLEGSEYALPAARHPAPEESGTLVAIRAAGGSRRRVLIAVGAVVVAGLVAGVLVARHRSEQGRSGGAGRASMGDRPSTDARAPGVGTDGGRVGPAARGDAGSDGAARAPLADAGAGSPDAGALVLVRRPVEVTVPDRRPGRPRRPPVRGVAARRAAGPARPRPEGRPAPRKEAAEAVRAGRRALAAGDTATARLEFERALALLPGYGPALAGLGEVYFELGQYRAAAAKLRAAVRVLPGSVRTWVLLGNARFRSGQLAAARQAYQTALRLAPGHAEARRNLSLVEQRLGGMQ